MAKEKPTLAPGAPCTVPVTVVEQLPSDSGFRFYVQAPGAHSPTVTLAVHELTGTDSAPRVAGVFLSRSESELVVSIGGTVYRFAPELELEGDG